MRRMTYLALAIAIAGLAGCGDATPSESPSGASGGGSGGAFLPGANVVLTGPVDHPDDLTVPLFVDKSVDPIGLISVPTGTHAEVVSDPRSNGATGDVVIKMTDGPKAGQAGKLPAGFLRAE